MAATQQLPGAPAIVYYLPVTTGRVPVGRWAHAAAVIGPFLYVYGGVGPSVLDDLAVLDVELMVWRSLTPSAARPKDRPERVHAAAMCAVGSTVWMFGGQQGRKHLRTLYSLSTDVLAWKLVTPEGPQPAAREGHSFTAASSGLAFLFGGQGKKLYNDLFVLQPGGSSWAELKPTGRAPTPRSGHSMLWDGGDQLVCFGGATSSSTDNSLFVYSISRNEWVPQQVQGTPPSPRTRHTAVLLSPNSMLVFGGCNSAGVFFNDAFVLNLDTWTWVRAHALNPPPPPRYHHSCHVVGGKVVLYGGVNPKQAFDAVVLLQTSSSCQELSAATDELTRMTASDATQQHRTAAAVLGGGGSEATAALLGAAAAGAGAGSAAAGASLPDVVSDLMKLQLRDLLVKRNMEELHITAQQKAEAVEVQLKQESAEKLALQKEVMQLKLIKDEAEAAVKQLREQLADASRALSRETAEHQATSAVLSDLRSNLESREQQLAEARQLLDSMSAELGILASRLHRLQQERDALRAARHQERLARREQQLQQFDAQQHLQRLQLLLPQSPQLQVLRQQVHLQQQQSQLQQQSSSPAAAAGTCQVDLQQPPLTGAAAAAAQLQLQQLLQQGAAASAGASYAGSSGGSKAAAMPGAGSAAAAAAAADGGDDLNTADSQSFVGCICMEGSGGQPTLQQQVQQLEQLLVPAFGLTASRGSSPLVQDSGSDGLHSRNGQQGLDSAGTDLDNPPSTDEPPLCLHGQLDAACLLCMCQRFLEATGGAGTPYAGSSLATAAARLSGSGATVPGLANAATAAAGASSSRHGAATGLSEAAAGSSGCGSAAATAIAGEAAQYRQYLSISELARNRLEAENAGLQQQVEELQAQVSRQQRDLRVLQAQPTALTACSMEELTSLEATLEASTKAVRQVVLQRSIAVYQAQASAESRRCAVCMERQRSLAFGCGHQTCDKCGDKISVCPFCRQSITAKIRLFE